MLRFQPSSHLLFFFFLKISDQIPLWFYFSKQAFKLVTCSEICSIKCLERFSAKDEVKGHIALLDFFRLCITHVYFISQCQHPKWGYTHRLTGGTNPKLPVILRSVTCSHTHTHRYTKTYTDTWTYTFKGTQIHTDSHTLINTHKLIFIYTHRYIQRHWQTHTDTDHAQTQIHRDTHRHKYTHNTQTQTDLHTHTSCFLTIDAAVESKAGLTTCQ